MGIFNRQRNEGTRPNVNEKYGVRSTFLNPEGMSEEARRWVTLSREITASLAEDWFADLGPRSIIEDILPRTVNDTLFHLLTPFGDKENNDPALVQKIIPGLSVEESDFGSAVKITESKLGTSVIEALESTGIQWEFETSNSPNESTVVENPFKIVALFESAFQLLVLQSFEVYEKQGNEIGYWSAPQLLSTRAVEHITELDWQIGDDGRVITALGGEPDVKTGELTFGEWSTQIYIPKLAQSLFYLAETPFPSGMFSLTRSLGFGNLENSKLPHPRLRMRRDQVVLGPINNHNKRDEVSAAVYPIVIDFGWEFTNTETSEIETLLPVFTEGLVAISTYLEDGFLNHVDPNDSFSWDWSMLASCVTSSQYEEGETHYGHAFWIPATFAGAVAADSMDLYERLENASGEEHLWLAQTLALDGVFYGAASAINTFVFSYLKEDFEEYESLCDFLLDQAVRLNIPNESTNALSNWGIVKFEVGNYDEAQEKFELALERADQYAEAEASFYLAKIHAANGNKELADLYNSRCQAAGGYQ